MPGIDLDGDGGFEDALDDVADRWGKPTDDEVVKNSVDHALPVEFGATITPTNAEYLHFTVDGEEVFTKGPIVQPPQPYFRPAADATAARMGQIAAQADSLNDYLERVSLYFHTEATKRTPVDKGELQAGWRRS